MRTKNSSAETGCFEFWWIFCLFPSCVSLVIQKQQKKPHHYLIISSSGLYCKGLGRNICSVLQASYFIWPFLSYVRTAYTLVIGREVKNFHCLFSLLLGRLQCLRAYQVFLRVCFKIQCSWTAQCFFFCQINILPFYWTGLTPYNPDKD